MIMITLKKLQEKPNRGGIICLRLYTPIWANNYTLITLTNMFTYDLEKWQLQKYGSVFALLWNL